MGWAADGPEKAAIHGVIGAIQASFGGGNALAGGLAGMGSEALGQFVDDYLSNNTQLGVNEKAAITQWAAALGGAAVGGVTGGSNGAMSGAATALDSVRYNYLDHKQIEEFAEKTKGCEARNDCQQIVKEMEALSLKQQQEMIAVCASDPVGCKTIYGDIPGNGMLIREAIDKVLGADVPWSMKNDMSSLLAQQIEAEGVVSSTEFAQRLQNRYGIDPQQAEILAGAAMAAVTGGLGKYQPNKGAVGNMGEFFKQTGFGSEMNNNARKTSQMYQGQSVYQAKDNVGDYIAKGDKYYLDGSHKNHLEVFDSKGKVKVVLNLDGSFNDAKTQAAIKEGRRLPK
jgi:filamentous hemagglutinin